MKEAKSEAEQIISAYRAEMEAMYQKSLATVSPLTHIHSHQIFHMVSSTHFLMMLMMCVLPDDQQQTGSSGAAGNELQMTTDADIMHMRYSLKV